MSFLSYRNKNINFPSCIIYLSICIIGVILKLIGFNMRFNLNGFNMFHAGIEIVFNVFTGSIFLIIAFSIKYSKDVKDILLSGLFLFFVVVNTYHIYLTFYNYKSYTLFLTANITYAIFVLIFLLSAVFPNKKLTPKNFTVLIVSLFSLICFFIFTTYNHTSKCNINCVCFYNNKCIIYYIFIIIILFYLLNIHNKIYFKNGDSQEKYTIRSIAFLICTLFYIMLIKSHNDIYSVISHLLKAISIFYMFSAYFVVNFKKPYDELQIAKKSADEGNNIKTDFIVNLSHELRTPINIILNATKLINCDEHSRKYLYSIEKGTARLRKVCESIIEFNQIENGNSSYNLENLDIVFLIDEILEVAEETADSKNLDIEFDFDGERVILIDVRKLKIILLNLISNIIKYAPLGGVVHIHLYVYDEIVLNIVNDGPNIPDMEVEKIFNKFYKSKSLDLESTEGLGIGLYIANGYSSMLGGRIDIINFDKVTGYKLSLPFVNPDKNKATSSDYNVSGFFSDIS